VSFYKAFGGLGGAALVGEPQFLSECSPWLTRHGAQPFHSYPHALAALVGLDTQLPKLATFRQRAITLAAAIDEIDGVFVTPQPPHVNGFHVYLPGASEVLTERHLQLAADRGDWLFGYIGPTTAQGQSVVEIRVSESTEAFSDADVVRGIALLLGRERQTSA
jgi:threonine aldolase